MYNLLSTQIFCLFLVATGLVSAKNVGPLKLNFEVHRGDDTDTMARNAEPYLMKRDSVDVVLGNAATFYLATLVVGSNQNEVTVLVDTGSSDLWLMAHNVDCVSVSSTSKREYKRRSNPIMNKDVAPTISEEEKDTTPSKVEEKWFFGTDVTITIGGGSGGGGGSFNTGSSGNSGSETNTCTLYGSFATESSTSFNRNSSAEAFSISYADGTGARGVWGYDTVVVGSASLSALSFAVANYSSSNIGVLGIGLPGLETTYSSGSSNSYMYENLPMKLKSEGFINKNVYSLYLNSASASEGSILFGAVDHAKYLGNLETVQIINSYRSSGYADPIRLEVLLSGISFNNSGSLTTISDNSYSAVLDSGSTLSYLPTSLFNRLGSMLGGSYSSTYGTFILPCTSNSDYKITLNFSGATISFPLSAVLLSYRGTQCQLGILEQSSSSYALFGDNVLRHSYIVYDLDDYTVSFGEVNYTDEEDIEIVTSTIPGAQRASGYSSTSYQTAVTEASAATTITYSTGTLTQTTAYIGTAVSVDSSATAGSRNGTSSGSSNSNSGSSSSSSSSGTKLSGAARLLDTLRSPVAVVVMALTFSACYF